MNSFVNYIGRPLLLIVFLLGLACFVFPDEMTLLPWSWRGSFVLSMVPSGVFLFLDASVAMLQMSLSAMKRL